MTWLATWVADDDPVRRWALEELLTMAGIPARPVTAPTAPRPGPLLVHATRERASAIASGAGGAPVLVIPSDEDRAVSTLAAASGDPLDGDRLRWDVVELVARLLRDEPGGVLPTPRDGAPVALDAHGRLRRADADDAPAGLPLVDRLAEVVGDWVAARTGLDREPRWPDGARAVVSLSHDVDHPDRDGILRAVLRNPLRARSAPRTIVGKAVAQARRRIRDDHPDAFWAFEPLIESEARRGFRSTYLFASTPFWAAWGSPFDVAYDVADARFRPVFARLAASGNEVGLHAGYEAWAAPGRIAAETRRLERASGAPVRGNRHHYWHLGPDADATFREHVAAGLAWDASVAFNDGPGFRRSVSLPFRPYDVAARAASALLQLPTACMDGALLYASDDVDAAVTHLDGLLATVVETGGAMGVDWHLQASVPTNPEYRTWADTYQQLLDLVAARREVAVLPLDALERWWTARESRLRPGA